MKKYKVGIIGYFANGKSKAGGQEAKTCSLDQAMKEKYGKEMVMNVDTTDWKKRPFKLLFEMICMLVKCENIVMLPAQNSLKIFVPFFSKLNRFSHNNLFYSVVGGWLPEYLRNNKSVLKNCRELNGVFVETNSMKESLNGLGLGNVMVIPNFKCLTPVKDESITNSFHKPYRLCTFSRVMKEKGIEDIVECVKTLNDEYKETIFLLDIYGKIDDGYIDEFEKMQKTFPAYIKYCGMVEPNQSIETIRDYFGVAFPTHYYTEGVPGTLIDACMAGVPVIAALWGNYKDVFIENVTGWGYEFNNQSALMDVLKRIKDNPDDFIKMRKTTLKEADKYLPFQNVQKITALFK